MKNGLIIDGIGNKLYFLNNQLHRLDGPAYISFMGHKEWYQHGKLHRLDGPAVESRGNKKWYFHGKQIICSSQQEFEEQIKLAMFW
jgi:hypothetical protein